MELNIKLRSSFLLGFFIFAGISLIETKASAQTTLLDCVMEAAPVQNVTLYLVAGRLQLVESGSNMELVSRQLPQDQWEQRMIYLTPGPYETAVLWEENQRWHYIFKSPNAYTRGNAHCSY